MTTPPIPAALLGEELFTPEDLEVANAAAVEAGVDLASLPEQGVSERAVVVARWRVTDQRGAAWAASVWASADATVTDAEAQYAEWAAKLKAWLEDETRRARRTREFMAGHLEAWALSERERTGRATVNLPDAKVGTSHHQAKPVVAKEYEFVAWAQSEAPELLRYEVAKSRLGDRLAVGEVVDHYEHDLNLSCGHERTVLGDTGMADWRAIVDVACPSCPVGDRQTVVSGVTRVVTRAAVIDVETGEQVPGADVEPESVTAKTRRA